MKEQRGNGRKRTRKGKRTPNAAQEAEQFISRFDKALRETPLEPLPKTFAEFKGSLVYPPSLKKP